MINKKYFLWLLVMACIPVIFFKDDVLFHVRKLININVNTTRPTSKPTIPVFNKANVRLSTHTLISEWTKPSKISELKRTSNATSTVLPQSSPHTTHRSKPKIPEEYCCDIGDWGECTNFRWNNFTISTSSERHCYPMETPLTDQVGKNLSNNVTVVSAYFLLPPFPKGGKNVMRKPHSYRKWMKSFAWIVNPLIIYTDDEDTFNYTRQMLQARNRTSFKVILIRRDVLWAFKQLPVITEILQQKDYPVHYPNTVIPAYNCMTHSKLETLKMAIEENRFQTKYFVWIDIGYFRHSVNHDFGLDLPKTFDDRRVAVTEAGSLEHGLSLQTVIAGNRNFVAGGCFLGRYDVLLTLCNEYMDFVREAIKQKWVGVEQQMLYAMYSAKKQPKTSLQLCSPGWFCLGSLAVDSWAIKQH